MESEPRLDQHDRDVWARWLIVANRHIRTRQFTRRVDQAKRVAAECLAQSSNPAVMWSGGKDSTALAHLVTVTLGADVQLVSEKDDLDYPGEREYVEGLADRWGARLEIITPGVSPSQWVSEHAGQMRVDGDFHSRAAGLSKACFYELVESANAQRDAIFLGLRKHESPGRMKNRIVHGLTYRRKPSKHNPEGQTVCNPLGDWEGIDVYAYLLQHGIQPLHVYRCVGFMHEREPWKVRKSWWIPGGSARMGGVAWLRRYWPQLYRQLLDWFPAAQQFSA